jgi:sigma-B regulation protein RsbU (phosphoserine phosphatase)
LPRSWTASPVWAKVPLRSLALVLAAIFCTFTAVGFLVDVMNGARMSPLQLALTVVLSGVMSLVLFAIVRSGRNVWLLAAVLLQMALVGGIDSIQSGERPEGAALQARLTLDAMGAVLGLVGGYVFFVAFVAKEGTKRLRLQTEIDLARQIHTALAPPVDLRSGRFEILGRSFPATEVGGDLVDAVISGDGATAYVIDVSGHGVPAGTLMAALKGASRMRLIGRVAAHELLADLNAVLLQIRRPNMFATAASLGLEGEGHVSYSLGGHLPVLHWHAATGTVSRGAEGQMALGLLEDVPYRSASLPVAPGDLLVVVTDGVVEATDANDREWGLEALEAVLRAHAQEPLEALLQRIVSGARAHGKQQDDQTVLLVRVRGAGGLSPA